MENEPLEVTLKVAGLLEDLHVPYFIGGSLASALYGMVRTTQDANIIASMHSDQIPQFVSSLEAEFYIDREMITEAIQQNSSFNIIHRKTMFQVDVFISLPDPFFLSELSRVKRQTFFLEKRSALNSPVRKILSFRNWRAIEWAAKSQTANGWIFWVC